MYLVVVKFDASFRRAGSYWSVIIHSAIQCIWPSGVRVRIGFEVIQVFFLQEVTVYGLIQ